MFRFLSAFFVFFALTIGAHAETYEVKMLNRGAGGTMVFEPDFLKIKPGDTVKFIATNRSHNAASIKGMMPEGAKPFQGRIDEELEVTFDIPGYYGIKCTPHYPMGMIMLIKVGGNITLPESYRTVRQPGRARKRFDALFAKSDAEQ